MEKRQPYQVFGLKRLGEKAASITGRKIHTNNDEVESINAKLRKELTELDKADLVAEEFSKSYIAYDEEWPIRGFHHKKWELRFFI